MVRYFCLVSFGRIHVYNFIRLYYLKMSILYLLIFVQKSLQSFERSDIIPSRHILALQEAAPIVREEVKE